MSGEQQFSLVIFVNTAVSKLDGVLFAPLQGVPCLGSFAGNAADEVLNITSLALPPTFELARVSLQEVAAAKSINCRHF